MESMVEVEFRPGRLCVYAHLVDQEVVYIGMGEAARAFNNTSRHRRWRKITKGGHTVAIVSWHLSRQDAAAEELALIKKYKPVCNMLHNGFVSPGVIGNTWNVGRRHTEESKRIMSEKQKISWQETKRKTGRRRPTKPIQCIETGVIYDGLREAARKTGAHPSSISASINGHRKTAAGVRFVRLEV